jgi:hypothetical protein
MEQRESRLQAAAIALIAIQVIHAAIPAETSSEGYFGLIVGAIALASSIAALVGIRSDKPWAVPLLGLTGISIAVGFLLYHALPIHSAVTNPYVDEPKIGALQWAPVIAAIAIGLWAAWESFRSRTPATGDLASS